MGRTVARATTHNPAHEAEGRFILELHLAGGEGIIGEAGRRKRRFCGLVIFTVHECSRKQLVLLRVPSLHLTRQATVEPGVDFGVLGHWNTGFRVSFALDCLFTCLQKRMGSHHHPETSGIIDHRERETGPPLGWPASEAKSTL